MPKRAWRPPRRRSPGHRCAGPSGEPKAAACRRHGREALCGRGGGGGRKGRVSPWLLLLAFFAEDILAAVLDPLALVRLGLAPAADFGRDLADLLLVDAGDVDRILIRRLHIDAVGQLVVNVVAVAELQAQIAALRLGAITDASDLEHLGEAVGHTRNEVLHHRALHAPGGARLLRRPDRSDEDLVFLDRVNDVVEHRHGQGTLGALDHEHAVLVGSRDAAWNGHGLLANAGHQNTSASTSPPTLCSRASASDSTPRGVDTMTVPKPLRMRGSSRAAE